MPRGPIEVTMILCTYASKTGNTKKVAEAIAEELGEACRLVPAEELTQELISEAEFVFAGFWVDKGGPDPVGKAMCDALKGKTIALFMTLGAYPHSLHAAKVLVRTAESIEGGSVVGLLAIQGAVGAARDPRLEALPASNHHAPNEKNNRRRALAATRPDEEDLARAKAWARDVLYGECLRESR